MNDDIDVTEMEMLPDDIFDNFDSNTKCGEIFVTKGELNYLCTFCNNIYLNLQLFSEHLFQAHQLFNFEPISNNNNNYDIFSKLNKSYEGKSNQLKHLNETKAKNFLTMKTGTSTMSNSPVRSYTSENSINCVTTKLVDPESSDSLILNFDYLQDNDPFNNAIISVEDNSDKDFLFIEKNIYSNNSDKQVQYEANINRIKKKPVLSKVKTLKSYSNGVDYPDIKINLCNSSTNKPFYCEICYKKFATVKNLKNHRKLCAEQAHKIPFGCKFCPRKFHDRNKCLRHEKIKHACELNPDIPAGYWKCQICCKLLRNTCNRKKHEDGHFLLTEKKTECSCQICQKVLSSAASLKVHMRIHNEENRFKCAFCPARFKFSTSLKTHELSHTGERQFQCRYCDKRFLQNSHRKNHEILHNKEKKLECMHCRMKFHRVDYLNSHIKNKHSIDKQQITENNRPFQCKFCQSSFTAEKYLKNHERLHMNGVQHKCKYCEKTSIVKGIIERHEKTHLKTKETFSCHLCCKQFESKNGLLSHVKIKHPDNNVLQYKCGKCEKNFDNSSDLQEHIRKVCSIAVKSFGCDMCSARFELEHGLKVHKAVTHLIDPKSHQKG